ncbi:MAG: ATP-binding cassette domain-containing protein [Microlunatus sp.]|nr:ATP-binding cassette domain-containing protein [Microlunatus sp.]
MSADVITVEHLHKRYGAVTAVDDVSFSVAEGEVVCLLGPNGAGKSTTVRMLATLTRPDGGSARIAGYDIASQTRKVKASIGYVAQHAGTDAYLTGRENLLTQASAHRIRRREAARRATDLLDMVGLAGAADRLVRTYSGGMQRRLEIAIGIVHHPQVIFLDEPTTGLDLEARTSLWHELAALADRQTLSILLTTHYLDEADRLADRIVIISQGRVIAEGTPDALKAELSADHLTIELADPPSNAAIDAATEQLRAADTDIRGLTVNGSHLQCRAEHGHRALPALLAQLHAIGLTVESANVTRPTLDDVYLHHAGRSFVIDERRDDQRQPEAVLR